MNCPCSGPICMPAAGWPRVASRNAAWYGRAISRLCFSMQPSVLAPLTPSCAPAKPNSMISMLFTCRHIV